jgi:excisionase family DNA binding protein
METLNLNLQESRHDLIIRLLKGIQSHLEEQTVLSKEVLSFDEAKKYLNVSESFLYKKTSQGEIPHYKPTNGKLYFHKSELESWVLNSKELSIAELEQKAKNVVSKLLNN